MSNEQTNDSGYRDRVFKCYGCGKDWPTKQEADCCIHINDRAVKARKVAEELVLRVVYIGGLRKPLIDAITNALLRFETFGPDGEIPVEAAPESQCDG